MLTIGIAIDDWKLPHFKRVLEAAGFKYEQFPGLTQGTLFLRVKTMSVDLLKPVVEQAQLECRKSRIN